MDSPNNPHIDTMKTLAKHWVAVQPIVLAYIRTAVDRYADAEDVLQAVAQDVVVKYEHYDPDRPFAGWALWLAKSRIIDHYRKSGRDRHIFGAEVLDQLSTACEKLHPEASLRQEALNECLKKMPAKSEQLVEMRYIDDMKPQEIADNLGTTSGTIRVALVRIRKSLENCITDWLSREGHDA